MTHTRTPEYEIYAIRYATSPNRKRYHNCIICRDQDLHESPMPMDFFVWVIKREDTVIMVDTGSRDWKCADRGHQYLRCPIESLSALGIQPEQVQHVVVTHMHWDHAGNIDKLPHAQVHVQLDEIRNVTGPDMSRPSLNGVFLVDDVCTVIQRLFQGAVTYHDGDSGDVVDGVTVHKLGGHTPGMQVVRVHTRRGWVVLASDASHFYLNYQQKNPFTVFFNVHDLIKGWEVCESLADGPDHIIPGHDPLVLKNYPVARTPLGDDIVRLDLDPTSS